MLTATAYNLVRLPKLEREWHLNTPHTASLALIFDASC
jgi:hypothetical protein